MSVNKSVGEGALVSARCQLPGTSERVASGGGSDARAACGVSPSVHSEYVCRPHVTTAKLLRRAGRQRLLRLATSDALAPSALVHKRSYHHDASDKGSSEAERVQSRAWRQQN